MKWIKLLVSGILLAVLAWRTNWQQVADAFAGLRLEYWLAAVALYVVTQFVSALRWQLLSRPLGFERPLAHYVGFYFIGMFFNLFLPTSVGGDVVRAWYLAENRSRRLDGFLSVLVDRGSGLLVLVALACLALLVSPIELPTWVHGSVWSAAGTSLLAVGLFGLASCTRSAKEPGVLTAFSRLAPAYFARPGLLIGTTLLSIAVQAANVVLVWLVGGGLGLQVPAIYYAVAVPMVTLLTLLPSINGMGLREAGLVLFLQPLGVAPGAALTLSFLWFAVFAAASLLGGAVYLFGRFGRVEEQGDHGPVGGHPHQGRARQLGAAA
jgi:uncharacterized membrane protein YbhN (UPF0104 family)